ncbi:hypothetical protein [Sphingobium sp. Sx8-8]|uniref:hypothetical protein n=1 Tax=Sphingobium sp. Sx8-8 TaxID=2933617 RepID=UPI001F58F750|nr:hypothetical protein [Sphingobium sp. Sx8-8]
MKAVPKVKIDAIVEKQRSEMRKALGVVLRKHFPDADYSLSAVERDFERAVGRKIGGWITVPASCVQTD